MMRKLISALNSGIANVADLLRVEKFPLFIMEFIVELNNEFRMNEVQECISNITIVLNIFRIKYFIIDGQIKEINFFLMIFIE
jgi:hypothetical protein